MTVMICKDIKKRPQQGWASLRALFYPLTHPGVCATISIKSQMSAG